MSEYIEIIGQIKPKNNQTFAIADVNDLKGGYIQVNSISEMQSFLSTNKLKEGMLCYVKTVSDGNHMYQYKGNMWVVWESNNSGPGSGGMTLKVVDNLIDLSNDDLKMLGQIVFVKETDDLRYYSGSIWKSFSRIYIQPVAPEDKGAIWIDTSEDKVFLDSNNVIQNLIQVINVLQNKIRKLEWAFESQMDFGSFSNNKYNEYNDKPNEEPVFGTDEEEDLQEQSQNLVNSVIEDIEPVEAKNMIPNATHLCIKSGTYSEMIKNSSDFLPKELLWCYDKKQLWIKDPLTLKLIQIGSSSGEGDVDIETMEQILTEVIGTGSSAKTKIVGIEFADMTNKNLTYKVHVKDGKLEVYDYRLDINTLAGNSQTLSVGEYYSNPYFPITPEMVGSTASPKLYINSVYTGDSSGKEDYNPVSHNFVELSNVGRRDINLKGLYLHYTEKNSGLWVTLPLKGVIKSNGTFLIRGAQCSVYDVNTTYIKIDKTDMDWVKSDTYHATSLDGDNYTIWDENNKIKFKNSCSFYLSGEQSPDFYKNNQLNTLSPWSTNGVLKWYVDLVGIGKHDNINMPSESTPLATTGTKYIHMRYFNMDPVSQATKSTSARRNSTDWTYIDPETHIKKGSLNQYLPIDRYVPKTSSETKNIFFDKNLLKEGKPNIVTCSLGYNAHTTRCFNWVSVGYYDEYIWVTETSGDYSNESNKFESFKKGDGRTSNKNWNHSIYDRIRGISTDGVAFTVHKFIKDFDEPQEGSIKKYYYKVGRDNNWSEERSFTLRNRQDVINSGFNFLHITDQQGFNHEEYESWRISAEFINKDKSENPYDFCINTGDATQNGNRMNEWLDYFTAGEDIFKNTEQMYSVGNNDLCPKNASELGEGDELSKINPINVNYFFTFELPFNIPVATNGTFVPSVYSFVYGDTYFLSMNSEITELARSQIYSEGSGNNIYTNNLKTWCESDLLNIDEQVKWRIAYCHEAPFTIITANTVMSYLVKNQQGDYVVQNSVERGGTYLNTVGNYWFSQFLQNNDFKLCICGHKHTFSNSKLIRDDVTKTMEPIVYDPLGVNASWYQALPEREKKCCQVSSEPNNYVKYVMCQATGFKQTSNRELPARNLPWLLEYYPSATQVEDPITNTARQTPNPAQSFPHYVIWNVGKGNETENPNVTLETERQRLLGKAYKLQRKGFTTSWYYKYNVPYSHDDLMRVGGNGISTPTNIDANNNIIVENIL